MNVEPDAHLALDPDPPAMQLDELPRQGQPEPGALHLLRRRPHLPELLEDRLLVLGRDADARVAHRDLDDPIHRHRPDVDPPALRRELDRIRQQVQHDLPDLPLVGADLLQPLIDRQACSAMPRRPARSRTRVRALSSVAGRLKSVSSSSIRPASILDRSRMSLIRDRRCWPEALMSFEVLFLLLVQLAEHPLAAAPPRSR